MLLLRNCNITAGGEFHSSRKSARRLKERKKMAFGYASQHNKAKAQQQGDHHRCPHFAVVDDPCAQSLSGSLSRKQIIVFLNNVFASVGLVNALHLLLFDEFVPSTFDRGQEQDYCQVVEGERKQKDSKQKKGQSNKHHGQYKSSADSRDKWGGMLVRPCSIREYTLLNGWGGLGLRIENEQQQEESEVVLKDEKECSSVRSDSAGINININNNQQTEERCESTERMRTRSCSSNSSTSTSTSSSSSTAASVGENDDTDGDSRALFSLGLSKSASMSALNELRAAATTCNTSSTSQNSTQQYNKTKPILRNKYGTRSDVPPTTSTFFTDDRQNQHQPGSPRGSVELTARELSARCHDLATAAALSCTDIITQSPHPIDTLVDWQYVRTHLQLRSHSKRSKMFQQRQQSPSSNPISLKAGTTPTPPPTAVMNNEQLLAAAFKKEPSLIPSHYQAGRSSEEFQPDREGRLSCADVLGTILMDLLRCPVQLSSSSRTLPSLGQGLGQHQPPSSRRASGVHRNLPPVFYLSSPAPPDEAPPLLVASLWPSPAAICHEVSELAQGELALGVNRSPFAIPAFLPLEQLCILMEMLQSTEQFVTDPSRRGALVGLVTREGLLTTLKEVLAEGKEGKQQETENKVVQEKDSTERNEKREEVQQIQEEQNVAR